VLSFQTLDTPLWYTTNQQKMPFLNPPSHIVDVIYGWSLRQMYIDDIKMWARFCPKLIDFQSCNLGVCPGPTSSPNVIDGKYNTMDCQCTVAVQNLKISSWFVGVFKKDCKK
jgi:hypothetical protein